MLHEYQVIYSVQYYLQFLYSTVKLSLFTPLRYEKSRNVLSLTLNVGTCWRQVVSFTPWLLYHWVGTFILIRYEVGLAPDLIWIIRRREKSFDPAWS
jgi:hypothetical protein